MRSLALVLALLASPALGFSEPPRGSELRTDLMDALRPIAEWHLGAPVEFVVNDLRVEGDIAFASVMAQRPGGAPIELQHTPAMRRQEIDPMVGDVTSLQALFQRSGRMWVPVHTGIAASDVWWSWDEYCPLWSPVLPEFCDTK